jgi:tetratricopeptide (TPR) repeat protein
MEGTAPVQWLPPVAFVAVGIVLGALLLRLVRRRGGAGPAPAVESLERRDLAEKRDVLIRQLRELDDSAVKRSPEQLAVERRALEIEAARVLRALDLAPAAATPAASGGRAQAPAPAVPAAAGRPALAGFLWGTGSAAAVGLLLYFVSSSARPRDEGATVTGNTPMSAPQNPPTAEAAAGNEENDLKAAVARNPGDVEARLDLARFYLGRQDMMGVWRETQEVLAKSPGHPRALTYQSLVRLAMGQPEVALDMLKKAIAAEPDLIEAYIHMALVYTRMGRAKDADATIADATRRFPKEAALLKQVQEEIRKAPATAAAAGGGENPHTRVGAPGNVASADNPETGPAEEPPLTAPAAGGHRVAGTVDLDPSLKGQVAAGTVIFVTLREAGFGAGPPMAAKRLLAGTFPVPFEITDADSMRGEPLPKEVLLEARADSDGDPMTRSPQDPAARQDDVKIGTTDVRLVLRRR